MEWMQIGEVARRTGLTTRTLRHYDALGLLIPSGRSGGDYRQYTLDDVRRLLAIQHLKSLGLGLTEIAAALTDGLDPQTTLREHIEAVEERIAAEQALLQRLHALQAASHDDWDDVLAAVELSERVRHPDGVVRFRAALEFPDAITTDDLIDLLRGDPEPGVREAATWALVRRGETALSALVAHLADPDPGVRTQMTHALGKLRDPRAVDALASLLEDPVPEVAAKAAHALGQLGGAAASAALAAVLGRGSASQRGTTVTALGAVGTDAFAPVVAALGAPASATRADAAEALGLLEDPRAADALIAATRDDDEEVRVAALMALASLPATTPIMDAFGAATLLGRRSGAVATTLLARTAARAEGSGSRE